MGQLRAGSHPVELMQEDYFHYGDDYSFCILADIPIREFYVSATKLEAMYMSLLNTRNPKYGYNYKDWTNDFDFSKVRRYRIPASAADDWIDPRLQQKTRKTNLPKSHFYHLRVAADVTASNIAKQVGVSRQAVEHWDRGVNNPCGKNAEKVAAILNVSVEELLRP